MRELKYLSTLRRRNRRDSLSRDDRKGKSLNHIRVIGRTVSNVVLRGISGAADKFSMRLMIVEWHGKANHRGLESCI